MMLQKTSFLWLFLFLSTCCFAKSRKHADITIVCSNMFTDSLPFACAKSEEIEKIITEAISLGAPIYNEGLHMACYRIYEWASYKILYEYSKPCIQAGDILQTALDKSHGDFSDTEKAWIMRQAFDKILGEPTKTKTPPEKESLQKNG
ncbi:MAG: hypothetical protein ABJA90_08950 [Ginsengibacter sp.]